MGPDRHTIAAVALLVIAVAVVTGGHGSTSDPSHEPSEFTELTDDTELWPYTSHERGFGGRTLAINVVVHGGPDVVEHHLREESSGAWNETEEDEETDIDPVEGEENGTLTAWASADGATRYVYVRSDDGGQWLDETYQLHDGDYFGARHHVRAYESPANERWVALQAHHEHWDWFRLRHTVDGVRSSQTYVEGEFMDRWYVAELTRVYVGNDEGLDVDGWVTEVELWDGSPAVAVLLIVSWPLIRRPERRFAPAVPTRIRRVARLAGGLCALYLAVRFGAIGVERTGTTGDIRLLAAVFYPVLVAGLPALAYLLGRGLDRQDAFVAATVGFVAAVFLDYTYLQVTVLPLDTLVHRLTLATALGLVASGAASIARRDDDLHFRTGALLWLVAVGMPLLRFL